ncbi:transposase [Candidatus Woesearchaeota archaeon]|nr:transposase [Candidatus Woesearchaeota archaeon]
MMVALNLTYDAMAGEMRSPYLRKLLGVKMLPSRSTLHLSMQRLSQKYIRKFNKALVRRFLKKRLTVIVDSTGIRLITSSAWYDIRIGRKNMKRDNVKLHLAVSASRNLIMEYKITGIKRNDSPQLGFLLRNLREVLRVIGDAGYLSRKNCNLTVMRNGKPFFMLKKNTTNKSRTSRAWKKMVDFARQHSELFEKIYHIRSQIEGVNAALKKRYGHFVRAVKRKARNVQLALRIIAFNIKQLLYDATARHLGVPFWIKCGQ